MSEIKNIVQIKRGPGKPSDGILMPYELGYDKTNIRLYIGGEDGKAINLTPEKVASAINADQLSTARNIQINLGSTAAVSFNGTENVAPGVSGVLSLANGGLGVNASTDTGKTTARANLGINLSNLGVTATASELNVLDGITATTTELNYVDGVTSAIQTQLNNKVPTSRTVNGKPLSANISLTASDVGARSSSWVPTLANLGVSASAAELNYVKGVTSAIQTQLNGKVYVESKTAQIAGNATGTFTFSGNVKAVVVSAGYSTGHIMTGFWDLNTSGRTTMFYGYMQSNTLSTWETKVTISGKTVSVLRDGSVGLYFYVTAFCTP